MIQGSASKGNSLSERSGPWLWGASVDVVVFLGTALLAMLLILGQAELSSDERTLPGWGFLLFIVAIDVAHVYSTLFRTYLDAEEVRQRPGLYAGVPVACFAAGLLLYSLSDAWFWRALAYLALFHFVRQQAGWVAVYRARAGRSGHLVDRIIDDVAIYASTLVPVAYWHAHLPRAFHWFVPGDFVGVAALERIMPWLFGFLALALAVYVVRAFWVGRDGGPLQLGKHIVVFTTALTWFVGIVATNSDYAFSIANVIVHGVPYMALLWFYAKARRLERPASLASRIVSRAGLFGFAGSLVLLAFAEELVWDRLVWQGRSWFFGGSWLPHAEPGPLALAFIVPLLATPQATHYVLDAVLWRRQDTRAAQARAMGFGHAPAG